MKYYISRLKYKLNKKLLIYTLVLLVSFFNVKNYSLMSLYRTEEIEKHPVLRIGDLIFVGSVFINLSSEFLTDITNPLVNRFSTYTLIKSLSELVIT